MTIYSYSKTALQSLIPLYLSACILLGGASREFFEIHATLAGIAAIGLGAIFCFRSIDWLKKQVRTVYIFAGLLLLLVALQLVPLPGDFWKSLPDRNYILDGFQVMDLQVPAMPLSVAPAETFRSLTQFLPPIFIFTLIAIMSRDDGVRMLKWTIPVLALASALMGILQLATNPKSEFYLYEVTNRGFPVGIFANANHQATLMLMAIPFLALLIAARQRKFGQSDQESGLAIMVGLASIIIFAGLAGAGSLAGYGMVLPILAGSAFLLRGDRRRRGSEDPNSSNAISPVLGWGVVLLMVLFAAALSISTPVLENLGISNLSEGDLSRAGILTTAQDVVSNHIWLGTGLGGFDEIYKLYENADTVTYTYANHAHNDYLQWIIEMGLPGLILLAAFVIWWVRCSVTIWTSPQQSDAGMRRAASLATMVVFLHSFVDYPLRTPAISVLTVACLAIMIVPSRPYGAERAKKSQRIDL